MFRILPASKLLSLSIGLLLSQVSCTTSGSRTENIETPKLVYTTGSDTVTSSMEQKEDKVEQKFEIENKPYFDWPVDEAKLTQGYLPNKRRPHYGIDLSATKGTAILASHDGTVIYAGRGFKGYGKMIMIEGNQGWATLYAHFSQIEVEEGQKVKQGELIGKMGRTGRATGVHLHFEIRNQNGPVDPLSFLPNGAIVAKLVRDYHNR